MRACLRGPNNSLIKPDFPCLADEIAEPRPGMNNKVAALTVNEKSINMYLTYLTISLKACPSGFTTYGMPCFSQRDFTSGAALYKLCRGIVGNKLKRKQMSIVVIKHVFRVSKMQDSNRSPQLQRLARKSKFCL